MHSKCFTSEGKEKSRPTPGTASPPPKMRSHKLRVKGHCPAKTQFQSCLTAGINGIPPEGNTSHPGPARAWLKPQSHGGQSRRAGAQQAQATPAMQKGTSPSPPYLVSASPAGAAGMTLVPGGKKKHRNHKEVGWKPIYYSSCLILALVSWLKLRLIWPHMLILILPFI